MFHLRHLPVLALLASCSVYNESLLDQGAPDEGDMPSSAGRGSLAGDAGGSAASAGSDVGPAEVGGDDSGGPDGVGSAHGDGGSSMGGGTTGGGMAGAPSGGSASGAGSSSGGSPNPPSGVDVLDDMEDGNFYLSPKPPRYGFWYVAGDTTADAKLPKIEELIATLDPPREASTSAVHFTASGFKGWGSSVGLSFTDAASQRSAYDAGNALGVSFWVRGSVSGSAKLRVLFPLVGTDPSGKLCGGVGQGDCLDHFATQLTVKPEWQQVTILFSSLHQAGWGVPLTSFDAAQMLGIEWSAGTADVDIWLDDLCLLRP